MTNGAPGAKAVAMRSERPGTLEELPPGVRRFYNTAFKHPKDDHDRNR